MSNDKIRKRKINIINNKEISKKIHGKKIKLSNLNIEEKNKDKEYEIENNISIIAIFLILIFFFIFGCVIGYMLYKIAINNSNTLLINLGYIYKFM